MARQITTITETTTTRYYRYDTVDRLTSAMQTAQPSESYNYVAVGNL